MAKGTNEIGMAVFHFGVNRLAIKGINGIKATSKTIPYSNPSLLDHLGYSVLPSTSQRYIPKIAEATMTTTVLPWTSFHSGLETLSHSSLISRKYFLMRVIIETTNKKTGQEGFEPPTFGFGDRRSSRSSYWPARKKGYYSIEFLYGLCAYGKNDNTS